MGNITSPEALSLRWAEICSDPALQDLPYKIELLTLRHPKSAWRSSPHRTPTVEIQEKTRAYLAAGAEEVWIVVEDGGVHYFDATGEKAASRYPVTLSLPGPIS